jgi:hypothetical protein
VCVIIGENVEGNGGITFDYHRRICLEKNVIRVVGLWAQHLVSLPTVKLQNCLVSAVDR